MNAALNNVEISSAFNTRVGCADALADTMVIGFGRVLGPTGVADIRLV
jgi:hypothetical protein